MNEKTPENKEFIHGESYAKGVMMNNDVKISVAMRKKDGSIGTLVKSKKSLTKKNRFFNIFLIRGIIKFLEGSTNQFYAEEMMEKIEKGKKREKSNASIIAFFTISFGIIIYFIIPTLVAYFSRTIIVSNLNLGLMEAGLRLVIFLLFFYVFTLIERKNQTSYYHGAEHKVLWAYRKKDKLTVENVKKYSIRHPSCGTCLLLLTILISIPFLLFLNYENLILRVVIILLLLPIIIGLAFEITLWLDKSQSKLAKVIAKPGIYLQKFNTKKPDDKHIEVAIASLKNLIS